MVGFGVILVCIAVISVTVDGNVSHSDCEELKRIESGWVCGTRRFAENGAPYASYRGIPYAKQPLGDLRFKELQPVEPWEGVLNATTEGPICYQHNVYFGNLMQPQGISEACMFVNIHIPITDNGSEHETENGPKHVLITENVTGHILLSGNGSRDVPKPENGSEHVHITENASGHVSVTDSKRLPILVFIHGGSYICGSGDGDFNGPEYLVGKRVIVITFNYRLDVVGFLSLGTSKIPGNNGIRDTVTLLRWVKRNAEYFGGNPDEVTLLGQSSGANIAHLLTLSPHNRGLFKRLWLTGGNAIPNDFTTVPVAANEIANAFLAKLGLNGTDLDTVTERLNHLPIEDIHKASAELAKGRLSTFTPVLDSGIKGITPVIPDDPETLLANGAGDDIPIVIGFNDNECASMRPRLEDIDVIGQYNADPSTLVFTHWLYTMPKNKTLVIAARMGDKYFKGDPTMDKYIQLCSDTLIIYPTLKYVRDRVNRSKIAPIYMYKFLYDAKYSVLKIALNMTYKGAGHMEDLNNMLKVNSFDVPKNDDDVNMKEWVSKAVANFVKTGSPAQQGNWPSQTTNMFQYQQFCIPKEYQNTGLDDNDKEVIRFFDSVRNS